MSDEQAVFSFELNESLYFDKGQEVEELRAISLDPEISIQTFNDYVSIKGVIELNGEYMKVQTDLDNEEKIADFDDIEAKRYMEKVVDTIDNIAEFSHRFPVEISVPTYRIQDLNDVHVNIESFDYELPENSQLKLYATIAIHGIHHGEEVRNQEVEGNEETNFATDDTFEVEIRKEQEPIKEEVEPQDMPTLNIVEEVETAEEKQEGRWGFKTKSQSFAEYFGKKEISEDTDMLDDTEMVDEAKVEDIAEIEEEGEETINETSEDINYLSELFRNSEEVGYTKMRLCIVQKDDTIDTIADRFDVSPLQLIKQNQLEEDFDVTEGQLLYIPIKR